MAYRILVAHPGADTSTHDVYVGLATGLRALGCELFEYALNGRIQAAGAYLTHVYKQAKKDGHDLGRPSPADILYKASEELVARALRVAPDVVLVVSGMYLHPDIFVLLRRAGLKVAVLFTESPYDDERQDRILPWVDLAWTNERSTARAWGIRYLAHAWLPGLHAGPSVAAATARAHDVVFVGTGFQERIDLLAAVDWTGIDFGLYGTWEVPSRHPLRRHHLEVSVPNTRTAALYRRAKIGLNLYRTSKGFGPDAPRIIYAESLNPRAYELAATGCFTLSDARAEVGEVFGDLVPTYQTPAELQALLTTWLGADVARARVAAELPGAVRAHTWHQRAEQVVHDLSDVGIVASQTPNVLIERPAPLAHAAGG